MDKTTIVALGGASLLAYLLLGNKSTAPVAASTGTGVNFSVTPTIANAPAAPATYNDAYYKTYQYPALVAANPNLRNPNYQLTPTDVQNYLNNYLELQQWWNGEAKKQFPNLQSALQFHWSTYGVPYQYSFVPFTPPKNAQWVPPPPSPKSSGSGVFGTLLRAATIAAGGILTVASAGTAAPLIAAGTSAALTAESAIHGVDGPVLNNAEVEIVLTSALIIKEILPFYLQVDKTLVNSINNRVDQLVTQYES